ncbi:MAG: helix-turn-helix domain-containing protein [Planctomycetota bacterium]
MSDNLLNVKEVSEILGVCTKTVKRLIHKGQFPASKIGRQWRIDPILLRTYIRSHSHFIETGKLPQLYFKPDVLKPYREDAQSLTPKYYLIETDFYGRLGSREDLYRDKQVKATGWMGKKARAKKLPKPESFAELRFWKVSLRFGTEVIAVDPKAFHKLPQAEQNKWLPFRITNLRF